ncbi:MAG TPA: glycosyltransferase 87 family protein, partial [Candidatus Kapabacteria bacterium]
MKTLKPFIILLFAAAFVLNGYQVERIAFHRHEADFPAYLAGAYGLRNGTNPYTPTAIAPYSSSDIRPFIYPLFIAWLWVPFTFVPAIVASFVWYVLSFAMMLYAIYVCTELVGITNGEHRWIIFGIVGILFASVFQWVLMFGQMDFFELLLLVLAAKYLVQRNSVGGAFLGAAISAKLMPIVVLPMVLRNWKARAFSAGTILLLCIIVPYLIAGDAIFGYYNYWFHTTLGGEMAMGDGSVHSFALA